MQSSTHLGVSNVPAPPFPPLGAGSAARPLAVAQIRVLIIEDEAMIAWMIESILEDIGFATIEMVSSGNDAIAAARLTPPDLIVSDINLGIGLDGVDTVIRLNAARAIPVVFISGYADTATQERIGRSLPAARLLRKPIVAATLADAITAVLDEPRPH